MIFVESGLKEFNTQLSIDSSISCVDVTCKDLLNAGSLEEFKLLHLRLAEDGNLRSIFNSQANEITPDLPPKTHWDVSFKEEVLHAVINILDFGEVLLKLLIPRQVLSEPKTKISVALHSLNTLSSEFEFLQAFGHVSIKDHVFCLAHVHHHMILSAESVKSS